MLRSKALYKVSIKCVFSFQYFFTQVIFYSVLVPVFFIVAVIASGKLLLSSFFRQFRQA
jgi:hypothetical protein